MYEFMCRMSASNTKDVPASLLYGANSLHEISVIGHQTKEPNLLFSKEVMHIRNEAAISCILPAFMSNMLHSITLNRLLPSSKCLRIGIDTLYDNLSPLLGFDTHC